MPSPNVSIRSGTAFGRGGANRRGDGPSWGRKRDWGNAKFVKAIAIDDSFHRTIAMIAELPRLWHMIEISKAQHTNMIPLDLPSEGSYSITRLLQMRIRCLSCPQHHPASA